MLGAIIGDTVGSIYEFYNTKDYNFTLFNSQSGYTDDSIMTMAVAYWLLKDPKHRYGTVMTLNGLGNISIEHTLGIPVVRAPSRRPLSASLNPTVSKMPSERRYPSEGIRTLSLASQAA